MKRIFLMLALTATLLLVVALVLGTNIGDASKPAAQGAVSLHMLTALAALVFAALVHALVLTYFMGTGRWLEETSQAYHLDDHWQRENKAMKYRLLPPMGLALLLLVATGALGGAADPASPVQFRGLAGLSAGTVHMLAGMTTLGINLVVNLWEYFAIERNARLIDEVVQEVRRIRIERGLPV